MVDTTPRPALSTPSPNPNSDIVVREHAVEIHRLGKRAVDDIIEIGRRLTDCRDNHLAHGEWLPWLKREFGWSRQTADNFIHVYELALTQLLNFGNLGLPISALYLLAARSTPEAARTKIFERAKAGEAVPVGEVKRAVAAHKPKPVRAPAPGNAADGAPGPEATGIISVVKTAGISAASAASTAKAVPTTTLLQIWAVEDPEHGKRFLEGVTFIEILAAMPTTRRLDLENCILGQISVSRLLKTLRDKVQRDAKAKTLKAVCDLETALRVDGFSEPPSMVDAKANQPAEPDRDPYEIPPFLDRA